MSHASFRTRRLTLLAQDPSVRVRGRILTAEVDLPAEALEPGPTGHRVRVVDYDSTTGDFYAPRAYPDEERFLDPYPNPVKDTILNDPGFHAQNVYAIAMRVLSRFEFALGRRVGWGFPGHQLKIAPHAFSDANAFYSREDEALLFGYFPGKKGMVYTALSHDIVAHETTHAILDGLRRRFLNPCSLDQAAFHEGFADVVALLSVFSLPGAIEAILGGGSGQRSVSRDQLDPKSLKLSELFGLAEGTGSEIHGVPGRALRESVKLRPSPDHLQKEEFSEPHRRGEILVAAMMNAFLSVCTRWLETGPGFKGQTLSLTRVARELAQVAEELLTMAIRAVDYTPPVHLEFGDYLSALLTADHEIRPDDRSYGFRKALLEAFGAFGISPMTLEKNPEGLWNPPPEGIRYDRVHFKPMQSDPDEMFRFVWENRVPLKIYPEARSRVISVRPCARLAPDGFQLQETVAECIQSLEIQARDLEALGGTLPDGFDRDRSITLEGGFSLVFDEYGKLKYSIGTRIHNWEKQGERLSVMLKQGYFDPPSGSPFATLHRRRVHSRPRFSQERW